MPTTTQRCINFHMYEYELTIEDCVYVSWNLIENFAHTLNGLSFAFSASLFYPQQFFCFSFVQVDFLKQIKFEKIIIGGFKIFKGQQTLKIKLLDILQKKNYSP